MDGISTGLTFIVENKDIFLSLAAGITGAATAYALINGVVSAYNFIMPIYTAVTTGASLSTTALGGAIAFLTSPITIAAVAIGSLIAVGVLLWQNWDTTNIKCGELKEGIVNKFNDIKKGISDKINGAKDAVKSAIDKMKGFFNFSWSLPKIKLPHFKVSGSANPINWLSEGVPTISVEWYKNGGIMTNPTMFGLNGNKAMVGGEAGPEAILPISILRKYVHEEMQSVIGGNEINYNKMTESFISAIEKLNLSIHMNSSKVAECLANDSDKINGQRQNLTERGVFI